MTDTLPALDSDYDVPASTVEQYQRDGHTVLRGVAGPAEIAAWRPVIRDAALAHSRETRPMEERDTYSKAFLQITNLWRKSPDVARFTLSRRFGKIAAELMGVDGVRLYHDQALFKEAGGGPTPWHQDQFYWPLDTDRTITMWMPLVDVPAEIGSMSFVSGSQRLGYLGEYPISDESERAFEELVSERGLKVETHGALEAGDATFHAGWILHGAPPNPTGVLRAVMTVIYMPDGIRVSEPNSDFQRYDLRKWLPGCAPGDLAKSDINPLIYSSK
jgi:ectoine hydroxylase-related dioxygenase (phytanoyl-CoA dioxygenase family)